MAFSLNDDKMSLAHIRLTTPGQLITGTAVVDFDKSASYTEREVSQNPVFVFTCETLSRSEPH